MTRENTIKDSNAVVVRENLPVASVMPSDPESILRYAIDHQADVSVIERMLVVRDKLKAEAAKAAYDTAMAEFQSECPIIIKEKGVPTKTGKVAYNYAPIEAIEVQIRPFLRKHGFSHTFDTDVASTEGWVIAKCIVKHTAGHSEISTAKFPLGTKTEIMSNTQVYAAALTFANRRALCNAYGLVLAGEDMDGQTGKFKPKGPSSLAAPESNLKDLARQLWDALKTVRGDKPNWDTANKWLWREEVLDGAVPETAPHLTAEQFKRATARVKELLP